MLDDSTVYLTKCPNYQEGIISQSLPDELFNVISPGEKVVIKPNWVRESHKENKDEWKQVITHPALIEGVILKVIRKLNGRGRISILDGPVTDASFSKILSHYPISRWKNIAIRSGIDFEIIDLRDHEWVTKRDVTIRRKKLPGDPRGKVVVNIEGNKSEFFGHVKSKRGYYGADYNLKETNLAHDGIHNIYSVSRTCLESDVFINLPKLKTHRKAGVTCCLKNLVGINTYKNFLPHHNEGAPSEGGDQFPNSNLNSKIEGALSTFIKQHFFKNTTLAFFLNPLNSIGKLIFGQSSKVSRNGSWYGNDTLWRMVLDLNKIILYAMPNGEMQSSSKKYIGIVDAIIAGEGEGPMSPDPVDFGYVISGTNPVAIDAACAYLMEFDPVRIPSISKAFEIKSFQLCTFPMSEIKILFNEQVYSFSKFPKVINRPFLPQNGWKGHIEKS